MSDRDLRRMRGLIERLMPPPIVSGMDVWDEDWLVPCPYCACERGTHLGSCRLSMMHTGRVVAVVARSIPQAALSALDGEEGEA